MNLQINKIYNGFRLIREEFIKELEGTARVFEHEKSGASLIHILNEEDNKVFTITFKTPPTDNKGAAHIVEHAVCCSSEKYPLKDTFIEMQKGSLCTALNACTYQDMTMYYCASQNEKDLLNLTEVYMDLIFNPLITKNPNLFKQEGWHYELRHKTDSLQYNGVVYNEMLSEYDDASAILEHTIHQALFPDTVYCYDSGGIPEEIVKLSYNDFLSFYKKHYHPSNAHICLYGNCDLLKHLEQLDSTCLKHFDKQDIKADIPLQKTFDAPVRVHEKYPAAKGADNAEKAILALSFVIGTSENIELRLAFEILDQMLLKSSASPLLESLVVHNEIGKCIGDGGYDSCKQQPIFSIVLKDTHRDKEAYFEESVFKVLNELAVCGIDKNLLYASISAVEFGLREAEYSYEPRGVNCSELIQNSALYGGDPFAYLTYEKQLEKIKSAADKGYFEELIKKYFLENSHRVFVILEPSKALEKKNRLNHTNKLKHHKKSLTREEIEELIAMNLALDSMQNAPNQEENLAKLPMLTLEDVNKKAESMTFKEKTIQNVKVVFNPDVTKDIVYSHLLFDTKAVSEEDIPYIGLLSQLITYVGTEHYTYLELDHAINTHIGGLSCAVNAYADTENGHCYRPLLKITAKLLVEKMPEYSALMKEILHTTKFTERSKIKEILGSIQYEMEKSFSSSPEYIASKRIYAYISYAGAYEDLVSGMAYYDFLKHLYDNFEEEFDNLSDKLNRVYTQIVDKAHLSISITTQEKNNPIVEAAIESLVSSLQEKELKKYIYSLRPAVKNEGYATTNSLQTIAKGLNYKKLGYKFHGSLQVIANILESTYLWDKVRLQGGAYGCNLTLGLDGNLVVCSYSDPHLIETIEAYHTLGEFLRKLSLSEKELHRYIIGTIGALDSPLSMEQKSERALTAYLCGITHDALQKARDELLATSQKDIVHLSSLFDELAQQDILCVVGEESQVKAHQNIFKTLRYLSCE